MNADQKFYDLRWSSVDDITERERSRVAFTVGMIPADCRSILDVGAGDGFLSNELVARGKSLTAVDISTVALARVNAPTLHRSADDLSGVEDRSYDVVMCTEMLEHLDDVTYNGALREFDRVARSAILITVPNRENMRENMALCGDCNNAFHIWSHRRRFEPADLTSLFPSFQPTTIVPFGLGLRRYNPLLLWIRNKVAGAWAVDELSPCPRCHSHRTAEPSRPTMARVCNLINSNIPHLQHKPWLLALYRRKKS